MARACHVCHHARREAIDGDLVAGALSLAEVARRHKIGRDSLRRHKAAHLSPALARVIAARRSEAVAGEALDSVLDRVEELAARIETMLGTAEATGQGSLFLAGAKELRATLELVARLTGELTATPSVAVNLLVSPQWLSIRAAVDAALSPYPDARQALATRLLALEAGS